MANSYCTKNIVKKNNEGHKTKHWYKSKNTTYIKIKYTTEQKRRINKQIIQNVVNSKNSVTLNMVIPLRPSQYQSQGKTIVYLHCHDWLDHQVCVK